MHDWEKIERGRKRKKKGLNRQKEERVRENGIETERGERMGLRQREERVRENGIETERGERKT